VSLVARQLEENGIATVIFGSAKDILTYCGAPRFVFTDFPLGNPCGRPYDIESQQLIMSTPLSLLETADTPGQSTDIPLRWESKFDWKKNFMYVGAENRESLRAAGESRRKKQAELRERIVKNDG